MFHINFIYNLYLKTPNQFWNDVLWIYKNKAQLPPEGWDERKYGGSLE